MTYFSDTDHNLSMQRINRRSFVKLGILALGTSILHRPAFAAIHSFVSPERSLFLYNTHTGETLKKIYWRQGECLSESLTDINYILRDHYTDEIKPIDLRLLDLLHVINQKIGGSQPFYIISGYRSRATNSFLRKNYGGVSKGSLHIYGKAVDIRLPKCKLSVLRKTAMNLQAGGVGYYPESNFIHIDVGHVRYW